MAVTSASSTPRNIRAEMIRSGRSQTDVAIHLGLSQPAVSRRLTGEVDFSSSELRLLAELFSVPVATFFGESPSPTEVAS